MALTTVVSPETAPHLFLPSMMLASISTVPLVVKTEPLPALKCGQFSSSRTCTRTNSTARESVREPTVQKLTILPWKRSHI